MPRILIIDDEPMYHKMIAHALKPLNYEVDAAIDGESGLNIARQTPPDLVICDVNMPRMSGYEVVRRMRRDARFATIPIIILTAQAELEEKLAAFNAGADDHMTKPFAPPELVARVEILLRRAGVSQTGQLRSRNSSAHIIAVHSLRGGMGSSLMAVNLALAMQGLWGGSNLLIDLVLNAGQIALMINVTQKRSWTDITRFTAEDLDLEAMYTIIGKHDSGLRFIAAPTYPTEAELLTDDLFKAAFNLMQYQYDNIIVDLPHDFSEKAVTVLDTSAYIILMLAPEISSVRAAIAALDTYEKIGYAKDKIKLCLNWIFERRGLARKNIESALHRPIDLVLPFASELLIESINYGQPVMYHKPTENLSVLYESFAYQLSRSENLATPPTAPTQAYQRMVKRLRS